MKKLSLILTMLLLSTQVYASPIATFGTSSVTPSIQTSPSTEFSVVLTQQSEDLEANLPEDTLRELKLMRSLFSNTGVSTFVYNPSLQISSNQLEAMYQQRMTLHNSGTNPLPIRFLSVDYNNNMTVADASGADNTVMYEIVLGYPIFYKITRYNRPNSINELQNLPTVNSDKLNTSATGFTSKIGNLYLG